MANDVTIVVEASLGDTLLKLELAKAAVNDLEDAGFSAGQTLGDDTDRNSFSSRIGNLQRKLSNIGDRGPLGKIVRAFGNLGAAMLEPIQLGADFAKNFEQMGSVAEGFIGIVASLGIGLATLAGVIAAVTFAATALASVLGTLVAIAADLVAPVTLLAGLLGGLGVGFLIAAKRAADGGIHLKGFSSIVDKLGSMFQRTSTILAQRFLPYLIELGHAAVQALTFLDKIIKLPLAQAFHMIDTQGTKMLGRFVDRVAEVLSKPIRLAFHVAFEDTAFANMVSDWWHRFTGFLFGEVKRKPIRLPSGRIIEIDKRQVDGIFQPLIDWFNRHHFTRQGIKIGNQILAGVLNSGLRDRLEAFLVDVLKDAGRKSVEAYITAIKTIVVKAVPTFIHLRSQIIAKIKDAANTSSDWIVSQLGHAWDWVLNKVTSIWNHIVSFIEQPISISIDWPSPPSWLSNLPGSGIIKSITGGIGGALPGVALPGVASVTSHAMAAPNVFVTVHAADLSDAPTRRRIARQVGKEITADWRRRAGGH